MDSHHDGPTGPADGELVDQLRQYADALAARADRGRPPVRPVPGPADHVAALGPAITDPTADRDGRWRLSVLAVAAAVAALVGTGAWVGLRSDTSSIRSSSDQQAPTTAQQVERGDERAAADRRLLPDPARWAVTESHPPQTSPATGGAGVWAWRRDGHVYLLLEGVGLQGLGPRDDAAVEVGDGRVMMAWLDGDRHLGLQGYGVDQESLRSVAEALVATDDGWTLPGSEPLVADAGGAVGPSESVQVAYSPLSPDGIADLSIRVTAVHRRGTEADLWRELFEASGIGSVAETVVAGHPGFVITGPFGSHGLVHGDGWVTSWQTTGPEVDLAELLETIRTVDVTEWDRAVDGVDRVVSEAVEAAIADPGAGLTAPDPADDPALPRYLLPDPWTFTFVTDMGLWSAEERAQREALNAANAPPGGFTELIRTQGFAGPNTASDGLAAPPVELPDFLVQVHRRQNDEPLRFDPGEAEPFPFAGLDGFIERFEGFDPTAEGGWRTETRIVAAQGPLVLTIEAPLRTEDEMRRFAEGLSIPGGDLARGVRSAAGDATLLLELPGDSGDRAHFYRRWLAGYTTGEPGDDEPQASLWVEAMGFDRMRLELLRARWRGLDYQPVAGGRYLADQYERPRSVVLDDDGAPVATEDPAAIERTSVLRYDPDAQILVRLDLAGDLDAAIALLEQLTETDLDTWRELVEPFNAKPLQPR